MTTAIDTVVRERMGIDPAALGPNVLNRAVEARMLARGLSDPALYTARLMTEQSERDALAADLAVSETWFFRGGRLLFERLSIFAGGFNPSWLMPQIFAVCAVAGTTAAGFTGIAYAEYARLGKSRRTEATGLGASAMFSGAMVLPSGFGFIVGLLHGYGPAYGSLALLATLSAVMLALPAVGWRET